MNYETRMRKIAISLVAAWWGLGLLLSILWPESMLNFVTSVTIFSAVTALICAVLVDRHKTRQDLRVPCNYCGIICKPTRAEIAQAKTFNEAFPKLDAWRKYACPQCRGG